MAKTMMVSRFRHYKNEVDRDATWFRHHGGKRITVSGKRGGPWRVGAQMPVIEFARFVAMEARRKSKEK